MKTETLKTQEEVVEIPINSITPNPYQPRKRFNKERLAELAKSIRESNVLQPVVVRYLDKDKGTYELVFGERRLRACQEIDCEIIPAIIRDLSPEEAREMTLIENLQREDLTVIEEAYSIAGLVEQYTENYEQVAERLSKSITHIKKRIALLALPETVQEMLEDYLINTAQAEVILELSDEKDQLEAANLAQKLQLSANQLRGRLQHKPQKKKGGDKDRTGIITLNKLTASLIQTYDALEGYELLKLKDLKKKTSLKQQLTKLREKVDEVLDQFRQSKEP